MNEDDDIIELGVYKKELTSRCETTVVLSDSDSENEDISAPVTELNSSKQTVQEAQKLSSAGDCPKLQNSNPDGTAGTLAQKGPFIHIIHGPPCSSAVVHKKLKLISWNVDGLNDRHLAPRVVFICKTIRELNADVVFLQEVIPCLVGVISQGLRDYKVICAGTEGYFTCTLLRNCTVQYVSDTVLEFTTTKMERNVACTEVTFNGHSLLLMNTHLESMAYSSEARMTQLKKCFRHCMKQPQARSVIFGGDTNLRNDEVRSIGGVPAGIVDVWEACGRLLATCHTWDMSVNDNLDWASGPSKPRCRFDRVYFRQSWPAYLKPSAFELIGKSRISELRCFPSDHWGLCCEFDVVKAT